MGPSWPASMAARGEGVPHSAPFSPSLMSVGQILLRLLWGPLAPDVLLQSILTLRPEGESDARTPAPRLPRLPSAFVSMMWHTVHSLGPFAPLPLCSVHSEHSLTRPGDFAPAVPKKPLAIRQAVSCFFFRRQLKYLLLQEALYDCHDGAAPPPGSHAILDPPFAKFIRNYCNVACLSL